MNGSDDKKTRLMHVNKTVVKSISEIQTAALENGLDPNEVNARLALVLLQSCVVMDRTHFALHAIALFLEFAHGRGAIPAEGVLATIDKSDDAADTNGVNHNHADNNNTVRH